MRYKMVLAFLLVTASVWAQSDAPPAQDQGQGQQRGGRRMNGNFQGTGGTISEINGDTMTLKDMRGTTVTVKLGPSTQYRKQGQPARLTDFHAGDMVVVRGESTGENAWTANVVMLNPGGAMMREQLGKKFIAGEITKIEDTKLTIKRIDGETQVIEVDENTSFRNGKRESITLADVKVGDHVMGRGDLKDGTFVPAILNVGTADDFMMMRRQGGPPMRGNDKQPEKQ